MKLPNLSVLLMCSLFVLSTASLAEGDPTRGRALAETCMGCHAVKGYYNVYPSYRVPRLGGQNAAYVASALKAYKSGSRTHGTMQANAANLTDQDMADIGAYLENHGK